LGFYLLISRAVDLLFVFLPKQWLAREGIVQKLITPGNIQAESKMKRGASFKVVEMVKNALSCRPGHSNTSQDSSRRSASRRASASSHTSSSPTEKALMNYNLSLSVKEQVGGIFWAWKRIITGKIYSEDGIWLHGEYRPFRETAHPYVELPFLAFSSKFNVFAFTFFICQVDCGRK
jgi:hypothetical protein